MTRFARAKGSKSSNEKKPEEATAWFEMKQDMLEKTKPKEGEEKESPKKKIKVKPIEEPKETEWASLDGDTSIKDYAAMIKRHFGRRIDASEKTEIIKKKNKKSNDSEIEIISEIKSYSGMEDKTTKINHDGNCEVKKKKKGKKRELAETEKDSQEVIQKKKGKKRELAETEKDSQEMIQKKKGKKRELAETEEDSQEMIQKKKEKLQKTVKKDSDSDEVIILDDEEEEIKNKKKEKNNDEKKFKKKKDKKHKKNDKRENFKPKMQDQQKKEKKFKKEKSKETNSHVEELIINGKKIPIVKFQGFYVTLEDAERLKKLRTVMINQGIPKDTWEAAIKLERRRAEKALSRLKKSVCFHCRSHGHLLSNCPKLQEKENTGTGICYKCGSTEHSSADCKVVRGTHYQFAECFICKEQGHIARQCPDNPRGLYPQGGACRECGDVTHLRRDCPKVQAQRAEEVVTVGVRRDRDLECLDEEIVDIEQQNLKKKVKRNLIVKF